MPFVPCRLANIVIDEVVDRHLVVLEELAAARRKLVIVIGLNEALAIDRAVKGETFARPLTHDLTIAILAATRHQLREVRIVELREQTFFAELVLVAGDGATRHIDARPSDALALLVRQPGAQLSVNEVVLAEAAS
ncbi:MAG: bifunctional nuclease family protein [Planctomycetota bacterium]|nr:bifunctional nuclease family protein [Planctomycetota bacterium]MCX8040669.1 bifunctional nuclease family protein [Planctomycetota bacterium]MDW8372812.1 bifunctional nuclease family protein [Planctomycetota bacterium]